MAIEATGLVEQFKTEAARAGAVVYEAKDTKDASEYVLKVAQERGVKHIVKSKSMLAAEIGLREQLENAGIEVKETDIAEWITQLVGGRPAHIVGSATRETIEQVAELLSEGIGEQLEADPQVLINAARRALKQSCIAADMGVSEASIAIAETGTLVITSNEGNDRLVAVLPPIHITMVGRGELVSTMADATDKLKRLNKTLTDRKMPSYVTYITGRNTTADIPKALMARAQGPEEEHIVLIDEAAIK